MKDKAARRDHKAVSVAARISIGDKGTYGNADITLENVLAMFAAVRDHG